MTPGTQLGSYEILSPLGRGGMGEVWRAKDTKLGREVAIKTLPEEFAKDEERLARFEREAKLLASLNHPNIATIYGLEEDTGTRFLVLELVEGDTLQDRLKRGAIPVEESLRLALQIAEALEAAHEKGVVHRDLKPGNIKVTPDGKVKVLDFGLAKAFAVDEADVNLSQSPTLSMAATQQGVILGTAAYMSPEQARGLEVDKRTDIWAFGCVLYEMLTGRQAFAGELASDILAAVIRAEPEWTALPDRLSPNLRSLLERCLEKELRARWHDIADVRVDIQRVLAGQTGIFDPAAGSARVTWPKAAMLVLAALIAGAAFGALGWNTETPRTAIPRRFVITLLGSTRLAIGQYTPLGVPRPSLALSADGSKLVYVVDEGDRSRLYLRLMDEFEGSPLPDTDGAYSPFFSPNGESVGFFVGNQLKKISFGSETSVTLCEASNAGGGAWGGDDTVYFSDLESAHLLRVSASGGTAEVIPASSGFPIPQFLPGGRKLLGWRGILDLDTGEIIEPWGEERRRGNPRYVSSGHLVYSRGGILMAQEFDLEGSQLVGAPVPVLETLRIELGGLAQFATSNDGSLVYVAGRDMSEVAFAWVDRRGVAEPLDLPLRRYGGGFSLSPDGTRLAFDVTTGQSRDIYVYELDSGREIRLTRDGTGAGPAWTPDGDQIAFSFLNNSRGRDLSLTRSGGGEVEPLLKSETVLFPESWSPDGKILAFREIHTSFDLRFLTIESGRTESFAETPDNELLAAFSPDGNWIAYTTDESNRYEVYVQPFPPTGDRWQVSSDGGEEPVWSPDGEELFYRYGQVWWSVPINTESGFEAGAPEPLFEGAFVNPAGYSYRVAPNGRFLVLQEREHPVQNEINVVLNWHQELLERVPAN